LLIDGYSNLRPYQQAGLRWLYLLYRLGLGACLADDMGLGKTIQVLSLLLVLKREDQGKRRASLQVAPASLLASWAAEIRRFAPGLNALIAHPLAMPVTDLRAINGERLENVDLVITSYARWATAPKSRARCRLSSCPSCMRRALWPRPSAGAKKP